MMLMLLSLLLPLIIDDFDAIIFAMPYIHLLLIAIIDAFIAITPLIIISLSIDYYAT
jgi:hypothetical protein